MVVAGTGDEYERYSQCNDNPSDCSDVWHVYLLKHDAAGSVVWQQTFGETEVDWAGEDIDLTSDGGAIIAVDNGQFGFLKVNDIYETSISQIVDDDEDGVNDIADNDDDNDGIPDGQDSSPLGPDAPQTPQSNFNNLLDTVQKVRRGRGFRDTP